MSFDPTDPWGQAQMPSVMGVNKNSASSCLNAYQYAQWQAQQYNPFALPMPYMGLGTSTQPPAPAPAISQRDLDRLKAAKPRQVLARMPDSVVPIVAWRAWNPRLLNDGGWGLGALGQAHVWEPKKAMEAQCVSSGGHPSPHRDCACGIWSFRTLDELLLALAGYAVKVFGQVTIWGRIIECENGFRSQFAYPKELWLLDPAMEQLGYIYGVPVRTAK